MVMSFGSHFCLINMQYILGSLNYKIQNFIVPKFENNNSFFLNFLFTSLFDLPSCKYGTLYPFDKRPTHSLKMRTYFLYADAVFCFRRQICVSDVKSIAILCS